MSNKQIQSDAKHFIEVTHRDYATFLKTGIDYSNEMYARDQKVIRRAEFISGLMIFTAGLLAGVILYTLLGVQA